MRKYKQEVKQITETVCTEVRCDICGFVSPSPSWPWDVGSYSVKDTDVEMTVKVKKEEGSSYPEGGKTTTKAFDICPGCFDEVLIPFIEKEGKCKVTVEENSW